MKNDEVDNKMITVETISSDDYICLMDMVNSNF